MRASRVVFLSLLLATTAGANELPDAPRPKVERVEPVRPVRERFFVAPWRLDRAVQFLAGADLATASWDVHRTQGCLRTTCVELDPLARPFVHNSGAAYAMAAGESYGLALVGQRMRRSHKKFVRTVWWAPQAAGIALHALAAVKTPKG